MRCGRSCRTSNNHHLAAGPHDGERGIALLSVMIGMAILAVLIVGIILATRYGVEDASSSIAASELNARCEGVLLAAALQIMPLPHVTPLRIDGITQPFLVLGQEVPVTVTSEFGKIDLNATDEDTLTNLLLAAGLGPSEANALAGNIITWRTNGAGLTTVRPFRTTAELLQVTGMNQELFSKISGSITVYSGRSQVDESTAPLLALESLSGFDRQTAEQAIRDRLQAGKGGGEVVDGHLAPGINVSGWAFQIDMDVDVAQNGWREQASYVIRMTGDPERPFLVLWHQAKFSRSLRS